MPALRFPAACAILAAAGGLMAIATPVLAAESYDNCTGFIDALPATIGKQGTWCLRKDLSTSMASGEAILVNANNVTLDCNDFKLGGLGAGLSTTAIGIRANERQNVSVRNCAVRGFSYGVFLSGDSHTVEDSRFDLNTVVGIVTNGDGNEVRGNVISATGGRPASGVSFGIAMIGGGARVLDNRVHGVSAEPDEGGLNQLVGGIQADGGMSVVARNVVTGLAPALTMHGIRVYQGVVRDNVLAQATAIAGSTGIVCLSDLGGATTGLSDGNAIRRYATAHANCSTSGVAVDP